MAFGKRNPRRKDTSITDLTPPPRRPRRRSIILLLILLFAAVVAAAILLILTIMIRNPSNHPLEANANSIVDQVTLDSSFVPRFPERTNISFALDNRNKLPPRNSRTFPDLPMDHITIVLYVHNRPHYLKLVIDSLSKVDGISETLLIVSHDGYFREMDRIVQAIDFCRVKQIFAPYSPHLFPSTFPGTSHGDCRNKDNPSEKNCTGNPDQYGNHRSPTVVSLKHHWWWMMNTVWDGLQETSGHSGHILFIEEDHFIYPNAYRTIQLLTSLMPSKCPECYAANLAPSDVTSKGEAGWQILIAEKMGNVGYAFNRTVWRKIHAKAKDFCWFDDYNWDITMWSVVFPLWGSPVYSLRGPRRSAAHFGKCGLHQGQEKNSACVDNGKPNFEVDELDRVINIRQEWDVHMVKKQSGYQAGFKGWGGWGDERDRDLCLSFAQMYHHTPKASSV